MNQDCLPITPSPELVQQWFLSAKAMPVDQWVTDVATQAARWGADQELEACCEWVSQFNYDDYSYQERLRAVRRGPKAPSLKEQALEALDEEHADMRIQNYKLIRSVLESLPDV